MPLYIIGGKFSHKGQFSPQLILYITKRHYTVAGYSGLPFNLSLCYHSLHFQLNLKTSIPNRRLFRAFIFNRGFGSPPQVFLFA